MGKCKSGGVKEYTVRNSQGGAQKMVSMDTQMRFHFFGSKKNSATIAARLSKIGSRASGAHMEKWKGNTHAEGVQQYT